MSAISIFTCLLSACLHVHYKHVYMSAISMFTCLLSACLHVHYKHVCMCVLTSLGKIQYSDKVTVFLLLVIMKLNGGKKCDIGLVQCDVGIVQHDVGLVQCDVMHTKILQPYKIH